MSIPKTLAITFLSLSLYPPLHAQTDRASTHLTELQRIADSLGKRYHATVLVDPAIVLRTAPTAPDKSLTVEKAMEAVTTSVKEVVWRRVYLLPSQTSFASIPAKMAALARALEHSEPRSLVITHPKGPFTAEIRTAAPNNTGANAIPVYLFYSATAAADGRTIDEVFADLQKQQWEMMSHMTTDQMTNPMLQAMQMWGNLDKDTLERLATPLMQAGFQVWDKTPPQQRQQMMEQGMQVLMTVGGGPNGAGGERRMPRNYLQELKAITNALEKRDNVEIFVDPLMFLSIPPKAAVAALDLDASLDAIVKPLKGVEWRKVYLPASTAPFSALKLSAKVRALEQQGQPNIILEEPLLQRMTLFTKKPEAPEDLPALLAAHQFSAKPVYILYSAAPGGDGGSPLEARYADLQRRQMEMLFNMSADQLGQAMEEGARLYQGGDAGSQMRSMSLPIMAGMMAIWFPRAAKERNAGAPP
jgi:hypothetical protein